MRKIFGKLNRSSKKGITLVELVVAITMTAIFAVACIALINPIERMYQGTVKLTKAQLLADTVVDAIRKECDDVKHDDKSTVWIANFNEGAADDSKLLSVGPDASLKSDEGNALIFQRNNNYTEAIYSCVPISAKNRDDVKDAANPIAGDKTGHSITTLFGSDASNQNKGIVHFGYYQSKDDDRGVFPIRSYDYTNPVTASTYGNFTVKLEFSNLTLKNGKYPTYVNCKISVYEGLYTDASVSLKGPVYTRSTIISFSANGSGKGSGGGYTPSTKKDIIVRVRWVDQAGKTISWPTEVPSVDITFNGSNPAKKYTLPRTSNGSFTFGNVTVVSQPDPILTCSQVTDYECSYTGSINRGYVVTYKQVQVLKTVKLINGEQFIKKIDQENVTGIVFGKKQDWISTINSANSTGATVTGPTKVAVPYTDPYNSTNFKNDYVLYRVADGTDVMVYVLSKDGKFVLNESCKKMFINCKKLRSITGLTTNDPVSSIFDNELTNSMYSMFEGCESIETFKLSGLVSSKVTTTFAMFKNCTGIRSMDLSDWDTSGVTDMTYMFQNTQNPESDLTIDISSFDFNPTNKLNMSYMFISSGASRIVFPVSVNSSAGKVDKITGMFKSCSKLEAIDNFLVNAASSDVASASTVNHVNFSGVTNADNLFDGCLGLKHVRLKISLPSCTKIKELFNNCDELLSTDLSGSNFSGMTTLDCFFHYCNKMEICKMNDNVNFSSFTGTPATMFEQCYGLTHLEMIGIDCRSATDTRFITRDSLEYLDLSGAKLWAKTSCEDFFKLINTTGTNYKHIKHVNMTGTELNNCTTYKNMFANCHHLESVIFSPKSSSSVTSINCSGLFRNCENFVSFDHSQWDKSKVSTLASLFENCTSLTSFNISALNLPICTNVSYMFKGCTGLSTIQMSGFTAPVLTNCQGMFEGCTNLDIGAGNLAGWDISKVTNLSCLFKGCVKMGSNSSGVISLSNMDFGSCETMSEAFSGCELLTTLRLNSVDLKACSDFTDFIAGCPIDTIEIMGSDLTAATSISFLKVAKNIDLSSSKFGLTSLSATFKDSEVETVNLSNAEFDNCESFSELFKGCTKLTSLNVSGIKASNVKSCACMFESCTSLVLDAGILSNWDTSKVTNMSYIFKNCSLLGSDSSGIVSLSNLDLSSCTTMQQAFYGCTAMKELKMDSIDLKTCSTYTDFVANCNALTNVEITKSDLSGAPDLTFIKTIKNINLSNSKFGMSSLDSAFASRTTLLTMNLSGAEFTACTTFNKMFQNCSQLTSINMEGLVASKVTTCSYMFQSCTRLITIKAKDFKTVSCTDMQYMFDGCNNVTSVDLKGWTTGKVKKMDYMFNNFAIDVNGNRINKVYITLDISDFSFNALETCGRMINTEATGGYNDYIEKIILPSKAENAVAHNLTDVNRMFRKRVHLKSIDNLGLLSTSGNLKMAQSMFSECNMLEEIDISSMNLSNVTNTQYMFNFAQNQTPDRLKTIYVNPDPAFALTSKDTTHANMFTGRTILEGQKGTKISDKKSYDKTYARIDGYNDLQGYFSVKQ